MSFKKTPKTLHLILGPLLTGYVMLLKSLPIIRSQFPHLQMGEGLATRPRSFPMVISSSSVKSMNVFWFTKNKGVLAYIFVRGPGLQLKAAA